MHKKWALITTWIFCALIQRPELPASQWCHLTMPFNFCPFVGVFFIFILKDTKMGRSLTKNFKIYCEKERFGTFDIHWQMRVWISNSMHLSTVTKVQLMKIIRCESFQLHGREFIEYKIFWTINLRSDQFLNKFILRLLSI